MEPLVFVPGMMCDARLFAPQVAAFSRHLPVTVAPVGLGESIEEIAETVLRQLPEKFALAGLSMGGIVAMEMLRRSPARITRIALMDTNALSETPKTAAAYEPLIIAAKAGRLEDAVRQMMKQEYLAPGEARLEILNRFVAMALEQGPETFVRQCKALQRRRDLQSALRRCKVPALVLCGEHDQLTPVKRHEFMAELIPSAELKVIAGAGHLPTWEQPDAVTTALLGWMKQPYVLRG